MMPQNAVKAYPVLHAIKFTTLRRKNTTIETCILIDTRESGL